MQITQTREKNGRHRLTDCQRFYRFFQDDLFRGGSRHRRRPPSAIKLFQSLLFRLPPGCFPPEIVRDHRRIADAPAPEGANIPLGV
jgi:hypothetical protein